MGVAAISPHAATSARRAWPTGREIVALDALAASLLLGGILGGTDWSEMLIAAGALVAVLANRRNPSWAGALRCAPPPRWLTFLVAYESVLVLAAGVARHAAGG